MRALAVCLLTTVTVAHAEPPVTADQASGVVREDEAPAADSWLWLPRGLFFIPRVVLLTVAQPIRGVAYISEKYDLLARIEDATFTDDRRFGAYPIAGYESTYGFSVGVRAVARDIFYKGERVRLRADYGGEFRFAVGGRLSTGQRLGRVDLSLESNWERRGRERFYGIGDASVRLGDDDMVPMLLDPYGDTSIRSQFTEDMVRVKLGAKTEITRGLVSRLSATYTDRTFDTSDRNPIDEYYDTSKIPGFTDGVKNVYVEHELGYDSRRPAKDYAPPLLDGAGWYASLHVGGAFGVDDDRTRYVRYGGEVQKPIDIYDGTRVLTLRVLADAVAGDLDRISFVDLPRLGGSDSLRGYPANRFRDRAVTMGNAEYSWQLANHFTAFTFVDIGGTLAKLSDVVPDHWRFGYGFGMQLHNASTFFTRGQLSFSREGDVFFDLIFAPAFGRRERAGRF